jgi:hypothetical protein
MPYIEQSLCQTREEETMEVLKKLTEAVAEAVLDVI